MFEKIVSLLESIAISLGRIADLQGQVLDMTQAPTQVKDTGSAAGLKSQIVDTDPFGTLTPVQQSKQTQASVTREQCGNALIALATTKGRDAAVAVLSKFDAKLVKDVKEADIPKFFAAIVEASK